MGRKRRGSQAFNFEQSHETLLQNENIVKLYQNKTFEPPEPKLYETLIEEGAAPTIENTRAKRGQIPNKDGTLVLGLNKLSRKIEDYKFWKQDDKERNKKRKVMIQKLWRGRKKPKIIPLDCAGEQKLVDIIADKEPSDDEEEEEEFPSSSSKKPRISSTETLPPKRCIWEALDPKSCVDGTKASTSSSDIDFGSGCVWANEDLVDNPEDSNSEDKASDTRESSSSFQEPTQSMLEVPFESHGDRKNSQEVFADALGELHGLIPESELAELLQTDDLLFCDAKPKVEVLGSIDNVMKNKENTKDSRKSLRRSARINSAPNMTEFGSIYTGSERSGDEEAFSGKNVFGEITNVKNIPKKKKLKRCAPKVVASEDKENAPQVSQKLMEEEKVAMESSLKKKKRRSYSRETGSGRFSLDGSRKNRSVSIFGFSNCFII